MVERLFDVIYKFFDKDVFVFLKRGNEFRGKFIGYDIYFNVVFVDVEFI